MNTPKPRSAESPGATPSARRRSIAARTASGRLPTATPTKPGKHRIRSARAPSTNSRGSARDRAGSGYSQGLRGVTVRHPSHRRDPSRQGGEEQMRQCRAETKEIEMDSPSSRSEMVIGIGAAATGLGVLIFALFPLALPIVILTIVATLPLALPLVGLAA